MYEGENWNSNTCINNTFYVRGEPVQCPIFLDSQSKRLRCGRGIVLKKSARKLIASSDRHPSPRRCGKEYSDPIWLAMTKTPCSSSPHVGWQAGFSLAVMRRKFHHCWRTQHFLGCSASGEKKKIDFLLSLSWLGTQLVTLQRSFHCCLGLPTTLLLVACAELLI